MKKFDYNAAKAGAPVCTRDGLPVRIVCWDVNDACGGNLYTILGLINNGCRENPVAYTIEGKICPRRVDAADLMMATVRHVGWVNVYPATNGGYPCAHIYETKEEAIRHRRIGECTDTVKIEWDE